jgi:hypothetical protein
LLALKKVGYVKWIVLMEEKMHWDAHAAIEFISGEPKIPVCHCDDCIRSEITQRAQYQVRGGNSLLG